MDVTVSLPDALRQRAKDEGLKLSRMLRDAIEAELERRDRMSRLLAEPETYETFDFDMTTAEGRPYTGRIVGRLIAGSPGPHGQALFLTRAGTFVFVDSNAYEELGDGVDGALSFLSAWLDDDEDEYLEACNRLGVKPVIELGVRDVGPTPDVKPDAVATNPALTEDGSGDHSPAPVGESEDRDVCVGSIRRRR